MAKKKNNLGMILILFLLITSTLSVFQFINYEKFDVELIISMSPGKGYQEKVNVDENSTAVMALSKLMSVQVNNGTITCVRTVCNEDNSSWYVMNERGVLINPFTHQLSADELIYFIYTTNETTDNQEGIDKAEKDAEAIRNKFKM